MGHVRKPLVLRAMAFGMSVAYALTNVVGAHAGEVAFWGERQRSARNLAQKSSQNPAQNPFALCSIAPSIRPFGEVRSIYPSPKPDAPLVIHIQDVHGNFDAQKNIAEIVRTLARDHNVRLVGLEGAVGAFATDEFRPYPDRDVVRRVGSYFLKKNLIGGPEFSALASVRPWTLWGIEDPAPYDANIKAAKESLASRTEAGNLIASMNNALSRLKSVFYNKELASYDHNQTLFEQGRLNLGDHVQVLAGLIEKKDRASFEKFPNVGRFLSVLRKEKKLDYSQMEQERKSIARDMKSLDMSHFPAIAAYMDALADREAIDQESLIEELERLDVSAQGTLVRTKPQELVVSLSQDVRILSHLLQNEMTPKDWATYSAQRTDILNVQKRLAFLGEPTQPDGVRLDQLAKPFEEFYAQAEKRNLSLVNNLLDKMKRENQSVAILVAGGFHTTGVVDRLKRAGANVVVVTPQCPPTDRSENSIEAFARDPLSLEKIFAGEPISLKTPCGLALSNEQSKPLLTQLHTAILALMVENKRKALSEAGVPDGKILEKVRDMARGIMELIGPAFPSGFQVAAIGPGGTTVRLSPQDTIQVTPRENGQDSILMMTNAGRGNASSSNQGTSLPSRQPPLFSPLPGTAIPFLVDISEHFFMLTKAQAVENHAPALGAGLFTLTLLTSFLILAPLGFDQHKMELAVTVLVSLLFGSLQREVFLFDRGRQDWVRRPLPDKWTPWTLRLFEVLFNVPFILLFLIHLSYGSLSWVGGIALATGASAGLRILYQQIARRWGKTPDMSYATSLARETLETYHRGEAIFLDRIMKWGLPSSELNALMDRMAKINQDVILSRLKGHRFELVEEGDVFNSYASKNGPLAILIPKVGKTREAMARYELAKERLGGLYVPMTLLPYFNLRPTRQPVRTAPFAIVQKRPIPLKNISAWPQTDSPLSGSGGRIGAQNIHRARGERLNDFFHAVLGRGFVFNRVKEEDSLGLSNDTIIGLNLEKFVPTDAWIKTNKDDLKNQLSWREVQRHSFVKVEQHRVPDVFEDEVKASQEKAMALWLMERFPQPNAKPHSLLSSRTLRKWLFFSGVPAKTSAALAGLAVALLAPLIDTFFYALLTPEITLHFTTVLTGMSALAPPLAAVSVGLIAALLHLFFWFLQGEKVHGRDFFSWGGFGILYALPFAYWPMVGWTPVASWAVASVLFHIHTNSLIVLGVAKRWGHRWGWPRVARLKPNSLIAPLTSGPYSLLTQEDLGRNLSFAPYANGARSVLYLGAGVDLNHVLTTFPDSNRVVMVGRHYATMKADDIKRFMKNPVARSEYESEMIDEYLDTSNEYGFVGTALVDKTSLQPYFLGIELLALGVDPDSVQNNESGPGISFTLPSLFGQPPRTVAVEFRSNTFRAGEPVRLQVGDGKFDGVYLKAMDDLKFYLDGLWAALSNHLASSAVLVMNQLTSQEPVVPEFTTIHLHSAGNMRSKYGKFFAAYRLARTPLDPLGATAFAAAKAAMTDVQGGGRPLAGPGAFAQILENVVGMMAKGQGPDSRLVSEMVNFSTWDETAKANAKTSILALLKAGQHILFLHESGQTESVLSALGMALNDTQRALIDTQKAGVGSFMSKVVLDYNARTGGKGMPLAPMVLVQKESSLVMDLDGFQKLTFGDLVQAVQKAMDVLTAFRQAA